MIFISRHAIFLEKEFIQKKRCGRMIELSKFQNLQSTSSYPQYEISKPIKPIDKEYPQHTPPL